MVKIAFALGGLAGNNAHGAGFLQAAIDKGVKPRMISCTSGQILWVYRYLQARGDNAPKDALLRELKDDIAATQPFPSRDLNLATLGLFGKQDVMRVAWAESAVDLGFNALRGFGRIAPAPAKAFVTREILHTFPARQMVMRIPEDTFREIAKAFNECDEIGIVFNSYDPVRGCEYLYLNREARVLLNKIDHKESKVREDHIAYKDITWEAVRDGLWIYQYGFEEKQIIDGAYHRQIILDELVWADKIFVARPLRYRWKKSELPKTWPQVEDLKVEMFFDGCYRCERDKIEIVNKLRGEGALTPKGKSKYQEVKVVEVELQQQRSYFDYIFEDESVFNEAHDLAMEKL